jgi:hypothetical protein
MKFLTSIKVGMGISIGFAIMKLIIIAVCASIVFLIGGQAGIEELRELIK